jgi:hypothetical protein
MPASPRAADAVEQQQHVAVAPGGAQDTYATMKMFCNIT